MDRGYSHTDYSTERFREERRGKLYQHDCFSHLVDGRLSTIIATLCCLGLLAGGIDAWRMMFAFALIIVPCAEIAQGVVIDERSMMWGGGIVLLTGIFTICCLAGEVQLTTM